MTSSPADGLKFQPPNGWHSSLAIMGIQFWKPADRSYEFLLLQKFKPDRRYSYVDLFTHESLKQRGISMEPTRVIKIRPIRICDNQDATYFQGTKQYAVSGRESAEATFSVVNDTTYMLLYVHPLSVGPNAEAETALRELCPKG
jgi:hypothetical protein